jgi:HEAT repeat protein
MTTIQPFPPGQMSMTSEVSDDEIKKVIGDFLEMGHVENILAMFKAEPRYYGMTGDLLRDERFMVRLGLAVLFEELAASRPAEVSLAIPALLPLLEAPEPLLRGEAVNILGIIGTNEALAALQPLLADTDHQVSEIAQDVLTGKLISDRSD